MSKKKQRHEKHVVPTETAPEVQASRGLFTRNNLILLGIILLSFLAVKSTMDDGHSWGDDFALYIDEAKAVTEGSLQELYELNKYSMDNSDIVIGPYLYPLGFPVLLSPVYKVFGLDFIAMKTYCSLFFLFSLPLIFFLFVKDFKQVIFPFLIVILMAFNYNITLFGDNVLSDLPFLFFCFLGLLLMGRVKGLASHLLLGLVFLMAYFIRDVGIVLIPTYMALQWDSYRKQSSEEKKDIIGLASPYLVFGLLFVLLKWMLPSGGGNIGEVLAKIDGNTILSNVSYYTELIASFIFVKEVDYTSGIYWLLPRLLIPLVITGIVIDIKHKLHYAVFFLSMSFVYLLWPETQGLRFVFPLIPFGFYYTFKALIFIGERIKVKQLAVGFAVLLSLYATFRSLSFTKDQIPNDRDMYFRPGLQEALLKIKEDIPQDRTVGFYKPRAMRLFTGRNSTYHPLIEQAPCKSDYILLLNTPSKPSLPVVFSTSDFTLYQNVKQ